MCKDLGILSSGKTIGDEVHLGLEEMTMASNKGKPAQQPIQLYEPPRQRSLLPGKAKGVEPEKLSVFAGKIAKSVPGDLDWEVTVEGSLEVGTGSFWPGAKAGFKASLTLKGKAKLPAGPK